MTCCDYYAPVEDGNSAFSVDISASVYGPGVLREVGDHARVLDNAPRDVGEEGLSGAYADAIQYW